MELTQDQLKAAESMSLEELRALAAREAAGETIEEPAVVVEDKKEQPRDEHGKFVSVDTGKDHFDNAEDVEVEEDGEPTRTIYRREIDNEDGSGVDVYEADTLEELVNKIAEGKRNANKKIRELNGRVKADSVKTQKEIDDEEFLTGEKMKKNPKQTMKEIAAEVLAEQTAAAQRSTKAQSDFVTTHPDYVASPENGARMAAEVQRLGYSEFTTDGLEKAYQGLKKSGLLILKPEEAGDATDTESKATERTVQAKPEVTQQRSPRKASGLSSLTTSKGSANKSTQPTLDEAYSMPLDKLRELANAQLSKGRE